MEMVFSLSLLRMLYILAGGPDSDSDFLRKANSRSVGILVIISHFVF